MKKDYKLFRVGNYVDLDPQIGVVYAERNGNPVVKSLFTGEGEHTGDFRGLLISEKLLKPHFTKSENLWILYPYSNEALYFDLSDTDKPILVLKTETNPNGEKFECLYYHWLQNIYIDKTGRELGIQL